MCVGTARTWNAVQFCLQLLPLLWVPAGIVLCRDRFADECHFFKFPSTLASTVITAKRGSNDSLPPLSAGQAGATSCWNCGLEPVARTRKTGLPLFG
jgi:hypothetical protein